MASVTLLTQTGLEAPLDVGVGLRDGVDQFRRLLRIGAGDLQLQEVSAPNLLQMDHVEQFVVSQLAGQRLAFHRPRRVSPKDVDHRVQHILVPHDFLLGIAKPGIDWLLASLKTRESADSGRSSKVTEDWYLRGRKYVATAAVITTSRNDSKTMPKRTRIIRQ